MFLKYFKDLFEQYKFKELCINASILVLVLTIIDYYNGVTFIYNKLGVPIILCGIIIILIKVFL